MLKDLIYRGREAAQGQEDVLGTAGNGDGGGWKAKPRPKKKEAKPSKSRKRKQRDDESDASDEEGEGFDEEEDDEQDQDDDDEPEEEDDAQAGRTGENDAKTAWVMAVYEDADAKEFKYKRSINASGTSTYSLNGRTVTHTTYNQSLEKHHILVKAKNFLVFQGDVEAIAQQNPKELSKLIDQISGSLDLAEEYNNAKGQQEKVTERATLNYSKKRGITSEVRHYREQREEVDRWEALKEEREELIVQHTLWRLFHINEELEVCQAKISEAEDRMRGLKRDQVSDSLPCAHVRPCLTLCKGRKRAQSQRREASSSQSQSGSQEATIGNQASRARTRGEEAGTADDRDADRAFQEEDLDVRKADQGCGKG